MSVQDAVAVKMQVAVSVRAVVVLPPTIEALVKDLPSAHQALPIGRRIAGQGCHGTPKVAGSAPAVAATRIRFVYFPVDDDSDQWLAYHQQLVNAEMLLGRVLAARAAGLRPIAPSLDYVAEACATLRPPRDSFRATLEYRRWYDEDGRARAVPLTREALANQLVTQDGLSLKEARYRAAYRSHALGACDQTWLIERRHTSLDRRPLNQIEFQTLVNAIEGAYQAPLGTPHVQRANSQIAVRVAAMLGSLLDEFVASPFRIDALSQAFNDIHFAHLRRSIEASREAESAARVLWMGPRAWFAAKAARMHAEHQIGLAMSPAAFPALRLSVRPVVVLVGGRFRTFMDGSSRERQRAMKVSSTG